MPSIGDLGKALGGSGPWLMAGVGVLVLGPPALRLLGRVTRPAAKRTLRTAMGAYHRTKEGVGDLIEESRSELHRGRQGDGAGREPPRRTRGTRGAPA